MQIQTTKYSLYDAISIKKERIYIDTFIIYTLWYEFQNNFDAQSDFGKNVTKKAILILPF